MFKFSEIGYTVHFKITFCPLKPTVEKKILSFTWCTQHKSTLDRWHMDYMVGCHTLLPQSRVMHHSCLPGCQGQTQRLCQRRWNHVASCGYNVQSWGTHDTPRSIQWGNRSLQASSASNHVTWQSRQRKVDRVR